MSKVGKTMWWFDPASPSFDGQPLAAIVVAEESAGTVDLVVFRPKAREVHWFTGVLIAPAGAEGLGPYCRWPDGSPELIGQQLEKHQAEAEVRRLGERVAAEQERTRVLEEGAAAARFPTDPAAPPRGDPV